MRWYEIALACEPVCACQQIMHAPVLAFDTYHVLWSVVSQLSRLRMCTSMKVRSYLGDGIAEVKLDGLQDARHVLQARPLAPFLPDPLHLLLILL